MKKTLSLFTVGMIFAAFNAVAVAQQRPIIYREIVGSQAEDLISLLMRAKLRASDSILAAEEIRVVETVENESSFFVLNFEF